MTWLLGAGRWLLTNPKWCAIIGLSMVLAFLMLWRVPHLESTIKDRDLTIAKLNAHIVVQNAAVDNWKAQADQARKNQQDAMALAAKAMDRAQNTVTQIEKEPVPTPDKECAETLNLLKKFQK